SNIANPNFVTNNILTYIAPAANPTAPPPPGGVYATFSEPPLGELRETVTVSGYTTTAGGAGYPTDGSQTHQWVRDTTGSGIPVKQAGNPNLTANYNIIKVDILITWKSTNGRTRTRE